MMTQTLETPAIQDQAKQESPETTDLLTVKDVSDLLRVPVSWVYQRTRKRSLDRLPGIRLGKYWRFRREDISAWLHRQR